MEREYKQLSCSYEGLRALGQEINYLGLSGWRIHTYNTTLNKENQSGHYFLLERTEEEARAAKFLADAIEQGIITGAKP